MKNDLTYRPDVDGLPAALPGGFLGVDVFFVISGYVITRRLVGRQESLRHFYASRARRLVPALYTTIIVSLVFGFLLLGSDHFKGLAESALAATAGVANLYFWRTSGYFETDAIYRPLLHLWTLGVEMQFYLVWPALLLLVRKNRGLWVGLATVASFAFVLMLSERVSFNFYNVPGRFLNSASAPYWYLLQLGAGGAAP